MSRREELREHLAWLREDPGTRKGLLAVAIVAIVVGAATALAAWIAGAL